MGRTIGKARGTAAVLASVLVAGTAASAPGLAPTSPSGPSAKRPVPLALRALTAKVVPAAQRCGEASRVRVLLTNGTGKAQTGTVYFTDGTGSVKTQTFSIGALPGTEREVVVQGAPLACDGRLSQVVRVQKTGDGAAFFTKTLKPTSFVMERGFQMPPLTEQRHWLRRVVVTGSCTDAKATVAVMAPGTAVAEEARVLLTSNGKTTELTGSIVPNQNLLLTMPVPIDCAASGIPTLGYELTSGVGARGTLTPESVTFEP